VSCGHRLCELIGGACSITVQRSRGCRPNVTAKTVEDAIFEEVRTLLAALPDRDAATRLAAIVRREAMDGRHLLAHARNDEPELAPALEQWCTRRS
jgi:hypothetical protein